MTGAAPAGACRACCSGTCSAAARSGDRWSHTSPRVSAASMEATAAALSSAGVTAPYCCPR